MSYSLAGPLSPSILSEISTLCSRLGDLVVMVVVVVVIMGF
jgi:hypothetical protein